MLISGKRINIIPGKLRNTDTNLGYLRQINKIQAKLRNTANGSAMRAQLGTQDLAGSVICRHPLVIVRGGGSVPGP